MLIWDWVVDYPLNMLKLKKDKKITLIKNDKGDEQKVSSKELSYNAFIEGKTIEEIAIERNLAPSTIESHLSQYVNSGQLEIEKIMPIEKVDAIIKVAETMETQLFGVIKSKLGDEFSYGEIRIAMSYYNLINPK